MRLQLTVEHRDHVGPILREAAAAAAAAAGGLLVDKSCDFRRAHHHINFVDYLVVNIPRKNRFCGLVHPGDFNGIFVGASRPRK